MHLNKIDKDVVCCMKGKGLKICLFVSMSKHTLLCQITYNLLEPISNSFFMCIRLSSYYLCNLFFSPSFFLIYFAVTAIENRKETSLKDKKIMNTGKKKEYDLKPMSELLYCSYIDYFGTQKEDVTERLVVAGNLHFIKICILYYCS